MRGPSLRLKVAAAFTATTGLVLVALGLFVYSRVQATLDARARAALETQLAALSQVSAAGTPEALDSLGDQSFGQVLTPAGSVVTSSPQVRGGLVTAAEAADVGSREAVVLEKSVRLVGEDETEAALLLLRREPGRILVVGTSQEDEEDALDGLLTQLLLGVPLALGLAAALGYVVAGGALRPVERMRRRASTITAKNPGERLPLPTADDEIRRLGVTLNGMLDRLDAAIVRERRFVARASHELRTPLALLRMELDLALARPRSVDELVAALRSATEEVERLTRLAEDLLVLAESDEGSLRLDPAPFDARDLLEEIAGRFSTAAREQGRRITVRSTSSQPLTADRARLDQALSNLVDNALRHGAGDVELSAASEQGWHTVSVTDEGVGTAPPFPAAAFEPFDGNEDNRRSVGRALGLAIVRAIVEQHAGTVRVEADAPGTTVRIRLPAADTHPRR